jgi:hypothetical protein
MKIVLSQDLPLSQIEDGVMNSLIKPVVKVFNLEKKCVLKKIPKGSSTTSTTNM